MTPSPRQLPRNGLGNAGLLATATVALAIGGWAAWASISNDRDLERRWAIPAEAKEIAEEEMARAPRTAGEFAEAEARAAAARLAAATELGDGDGTARARFRAEMDAAHEKAERQAREWERTHADRRRQLRQQAIALAAEWDDLFARHPEWPRQRLAPAE